MPAVRVMFVGQGASGLSEDRCVNTFYFDVAGGGVTEATHDAAKLAVQNFYLGLGVAPIAQAYAVGAYLSPWISRFAELISYDMADPKPRIPHSTDLLLPAARSSSGLPEEVAVVLSTRGDPPASPRRRGRLFLGPLCTSASAPGSTTDPARPHSDLILDLGKAASRLCAEGAEGIQWCIRSVTPSENYVPIRAGYVDDAFDTQRRRGPDASVRVSWTALIP